MSDTDTRTARPWVLTFPTKRPDDFVPPTAKQKNYMRQLVGFYVNTVPRASVGDILMYYWAHDMIELGNDWEVLRHPIFVYQNYCEWFDLDPDTEWDNEFNPLTWARRLLDANMAY